MGNSVSTKKVNFEDIQYLFKNTKPYLLINTLNSNEQDIILANTINGEHRIKYIIDERYFNKKYCLNK